MKRPELRIFILTGHVTGDLGGIAINSAAVKLKKKIQIFFKHPVFQMYFI